MNDTTRQRPEWCRVRPGEEIDPIALKVPLRESMRGYVERGIPEGSFVEAVIAGDLFEAAAKADCHNQHLLWEYAYWFYNFAPRACYGSDMAYRLWLAMHAVARHWASHPPQVGQRVRTLAAFSGVLSGTAGVIDELYENGVMVAWDLPDHALPPGYDRYDDKPAIQTGIVRNGFALEELRFLTPVEEVLHEPHDGT